MFKFLNQIKETHENVLSIYRHLSHEYGSLITRYKREATFHGVVMAMHQALIDEYVPQDQKDKLEHLVEQARKKYLQQTTSYQTSELKVDTNGTESTN